MGEWVSLPGGRVSLVPCHLGGGVCPGGGYVQGVGGHEWDITAHGLQAGGTHPTAMLSFFSRDNIL